MKKKRQKIAVGLSGGVDSSVAAALLIEKNFDVTGLSMTIYNESFIIEDYGKHACYGPDEQEDIESAANVCKKLGIPFHAIDLRKEFEAHVINYFKKEYLSGRTPNPCIICNRELKFGFLLDRARSSGIEFDLFATGHYARIVECNGKFLLKRARDLSKDQTYFIYALTPDQLSRTIFPIGELKKDRVRELAKNFGLKTSDRPESQDFISGGDYSSIFREDEVKEGDIINEQGESLGRHKGIIHYTIGQRKGLGISSRKPLYVTDIDVSQNRIIVSGKKALFSKGLIVRDLNLISIDRIDDHIRAEVKIRLQHKEASATIYPYMKDMVKVIFDKPQISITPGQSAVFYQGDIVLGGGIIEERIV